MTASNPTAKLSMTKANALGVSVLLAIAGLCYALGVRPAQAAARRTGEVQTQIAAATADIDASRAKRGALERKIAEYERRIAEDTGPSAVPESLNERLLRLSTTAHRFGLNVISSEDAGQTVRDHYTVRSIILEGHGGYAETTAFLRAVLEEFPDMRVNGLRLQTLASGVSGPSFRIDCAWYQGSAASTPQ
jgi:hypothetical protein